jgi:hypothetical protein
MSGMIGSCKFVFDRVLVAIAFAGALLAWSAPATAGVISLTNHGGSPDGWTLVESADDILLDKGFAFGDWTGFIEVDAPAGATGVVYATLFQALLPFQGAATITGPNGFSLNVPAGSPELMAPVAFLAGSNRFDFAVSGVGTGPWLFKTAITSSVPAPGPLMLLLPVLLGLALIRRVRLG